ncbi:MAG: T9SS type A sorting domain-containing protein, partial [Crocinitomicaceae bacterium]|nr:T9SS type A sorting domain-containing protein [Crocinitomicaceae bacterium]
IGLRILREAMPGYDVVGIDCDNSGANIIGSGGAIHCITKAIGVDDPLLISHQELPNTADVVNPYNVDALIMHRSGIASATLFYKVGMTGTYVPVAMINTSADNWSADIPAQSAGTKVFYYINATSISGKNQVRPITAPVGYFHFEVSESVGVTSAEISFGRVFPNPSAGLTCIEVKNTTSFSGTLSVYNVLGQELETIHSGFFSGHNRKYFIDVSDYSAGAYQVVLKSNSISQSMPLLVH